MMTKRFLKWSCCALLVLPMVGCDTIRREQEREMNHTVDSTVAKMVLEHSALQSRLSYAPGYLVIKRSGSGIPMVGRRGIGVVTDSKSQQRTNIRLLELEIDGGWGVGDFTGLYLFQSPEDLQQASTNRWSAENAGEIFVSADGRPSTAYAVKRISIEKKD